MKAIYLSVFLLSGFGIASANASVTPANWISSTDSTAIGEIGGITINATTSSTSPFIGIVNNRFAVGGSGGWDGSMPLGPDALAITASYVNAGDYQEFTFSSPLTGGGLFYIENFDSSSIATITATGATSLTLVDKSSSISFAALSGDSGTLTTSNAGFDGEGDAVLQFTGDLTSIRVEYTSGEGANGIFYTFAQSAAVPEPTSLLVMAGLFSIGGAFVGLRRRKHGQ